MFTAKIDRPKLEASLKRAAMAFGETSQQSVIRWGVSVCRDLAKQTQAWGDNAKARKTQEGAMIADAYNVILIVDVMGAKNKRALRSPEEVGDWIELNRTRRRARTAHLNFADKKVTTRAIFDRAMKIRFKRVGMAKGGWLGAGMTLARAQSGQDRINIGKNFLSYAQKHASLGSAKPATVGFSPVAELLNRSAHSASQYVLSDKAKKQAIEWGLKKTLTWYRKATKQALDKV